MEKDFPSLKEEGYKIAEQRSLAVVGEQLKAVYEKVMQLWKVFCVIMCVIY